MILALLLVVAGAIGGGVVLGVQALLPAPAASDVRGYLLAHPEVIPEAMTALRDRETGKAIAANRAGIVEPFAGAVGGNPQGDVTVVAYMDYACGYCRAALPELDALVKADPKVRIVYRELPILSAESRTAAEWSLAAAEQGKFTAFHEALFAAGRPNQQTIAAAAAAAGLDMPRATAYAGSAPVAAEITKNLKIAGELGMSGTPSWVIGDHLASGAIGYEALLDAVKAARAKG
jgi:protein-disulfide isomerase